MNKCRGTCGISIGMRVAAVKAVKAVVIAVETVVVGLVMMGVAMMGVAIGVS